EGEKRRQDELEEMADAMRGADEGDDLQILALADLLRGARGFRHPFLQISFSSRAIMRRAARSSPPSAGTIRHARGAEPASTLRQYPHPPIAFRQWAPPSPTRGAGNRRCFGRNPLPLWERVG